MIQLLKKALVAFQKDELYLRFFSYINKSPLRWGLKYWFRLRYWSVYRGRKTFYQKLNIHLDSQQSRALNGVRQNGFADVSDIMSSNELLALDRYTENLLKS